MHAGVQLLNVFISITKVSILTKLWLIVFLEQMIVIQTVNKVSSSIKSPKVHLCVHNSPPLGPLRAKWSHLKCEVLVAVTFNKFFSGDELREY
jgi:hypothetical protein